MQLSCFCQIYAAATLCQIFYVGVPAVAALLQLIILPFCPESPPWLYITKSRVADASKALKTFRGAGGSIESELTAYSEEKIEQDNREKVLSQLSMR